MRRLRLAPFGVLALLASGRDAYAYDYQGNVRVGAYVDREHLDYETNGASNNDNMIYSMRGFLDVTNITEKRYEFVTDIRDNHDFFDKLDSERLELQGGDKFRVRQFVLKDPGVGENYYWSIGRFQPADNGVIYNDGVEGGVKLSGTSRVGMFGGYRPRVNDEQAVELTATAVQAGVYHLYQDNGADWGESRYMANMLVYAPKFFGDTPQQAVDYVNQTLWRWAAGASSLSSYLDLQATPQVHAENALIIYDQTLSANWSTDLVLSRLDLTEYAYQREINETLAPSPYEQGKIEVRDRLDDQRRLRGYVLAGQRQLDSKRRVEGAGGIDWTKLMAGHLQASTMLGYRLNFISHDVFADFSATHYSADWEVSATLRLAQEARDDGNTLHPVILSTNVGYVFTRQLLGGLGFEVARDEVSTIASGLLTLGYRFGNRDFTPLRDVAPPNERR